MNFFLRFTALKIENDIFKVLSLILSIVILVLGFMLFNKTATVIVVPPKIQKEFEISGNVISKPYFEQIGFYISDRLLSVSPETVEDSFDTVMSFFTTEPNAVKDIREHMSKEARAIKENDISQVFYPQKILINDKAAIFSVEGNLKRLTGNTYLSSEKKRVDYKFRVTDGRLIILGVEVK